MGRVALPHQQRVARCVHGLEPACDAPPLRRRQARQQPVLVQRHHVRGRVARHELQHQVLGPLHGGVEVVERGQRQTLQRAGGLGRCRRRRDDQGPLALPHPLGDGGQQPQPAGIRTRHPPHVDHDHVGRLGPALQAPRQELRGGERELALQLEDGGAPAVGGERVALHAAAHALGRQVGGGGGGAQRRRRPLAGAHEVQAEVAREVAADADAPHAVAARVDPAASRRRCPAGPAAPPACRRRRRSWPAARR